MRVDFGLLFAGVAFAAAGVWLCTMTNSIAAIVLIALLAAIPAGVLLLFAFHEPTDGELEAESWNASGKESQRTKDMQARK
jgi:hypothetical protein